MTGRFRHNATVGAALLGCTMLSACYKPLNPVVPAGDAAYAAVQSPGETQVSRYALQAGDVVNIRVFEEPELTLEDATIDQGGNISMPLLGDVAAAGFSPGELGERIEAAYRNGILRDPRVFVSLKQARENTIAVEGEVQLPGVYPWQAGDTLLVALARAQSPTETASLDEIIVFRTVQGEKMAGRFDLHAIRGGRAPDLALRPGDVIVVGYSALRGAYQDVLRAVPAFGIFRPIR